MLSIFAVFILFLAFPQIEQFLAVYTNGVMFLVYGIVKGGHHSEETKQKISKANNGKQAWNKGLKDWMSPEGRANIAHSNSTRYNSPETRYKMGSATRGKPSHRRGKHLTLEHIRNVVIGLKNSKVFPKCVTEYHEKKVKRFLRELYDLPEDVDFIPASKYEHEFARKVLIEGKYSYGFITYSGLRETPDWITSNNSGGRLFT